MPSADGPPEQRRGGGDLVRRVAHGAAREDHVEPKWKEAHAIAQPGAKLRSLAKQRRSLTRELRGRLQHMEQHCSLLSDDYKRLAGLDSELHRVVDTLRSAFATEQEALSRQQCGGSVAGIR